MEKEKIKLLSALIEKPSTYEIEVIDNSMLPLSKLDSKTIVLTVRPPSLETLSKCAIPVLKIPEEIKNSTGLTLEDAIKYTDEMVESIAIIVHGKSSEIPDWLIPFIKNNLTPKELYHIFIETVMKLQSDFFLSSFQIVGKDNPMMMSQMK